MFANSNNFLHDLICYTDVVNLVAERNLTNKLFLDIDNVSRIIEETYSM